MAQSQMQVFRVLTRKILNKEKRRPGEERRF